jgi:hypothetical protein
MMSFSLRWLFAIVALAAIFTAALIYRTHLWTVIAINTTVLVLLGATIGVLLRRFNKTFTLAFLVAGWFYLAVSFSSATLSRLAYYLPSSAITVTLLRASLEAHLAQPLHDDVMQMILFAGLDNVLGPSPSRSAIEEILECRRTLDIINAFTALVVGTLAGIISVLLIRPIREAGTTDAV